jgi:hypothetical protein
MGVQFSTFLSCPGFALTASSSIGVIVIQGATAFTVTGPRRAHSQARFLVSCSIAALVMAYTEPTQQQQQQQATQRCEEGATKTGHVWGEREGE